MCIPKVIETTTKHRSDKVCDGPLALSVRACVKLNYILYPSR
uniref:Uncharacterized protein n=1 Tax=Anguilla anguilla TaxID=7936 RepID=A0A0E9U0V3_ANGAN